MAKTRNRFKRKATTTDRTIRIKGTKQVTRLLDQVPTDVEKSVKAALQGAAASVENGTGEKIKTSLYLDHSLVARAKEQARHRGISLNAYISIVLYNAMQTTGDARLDRAMGLSLPAPPPPAEPKKKKPPTWGTGYTLPGDGENESAFVAWEDVERYAKAQGEDLDADFITLGKRLNLSMDEARAADIAQGTQAFEDYMEDKHGRAD